MCKGTKEEKCKMGSKISEQYILAIAKSKCGRLGSGLKGRWGSKSGRPCMPLKEFSLYTFT